MEPSIAINASEIGKSMFANLPPQLVGSLSTLMTILKAVGIVFLIYLIFLIIKSITAIRTNSIIKKISRNVEEINQKLDLIVKKKIPKASKK